MATRAKKTKVLAKAKSAVKNTVRKATAKVKAKVKASKTQATARSKPSAAAPRGGRTTAAAGRAAVTAVAQKSPAKKAAKTEHPVEHEVEQFVATQVRPPWRAVMAELRMVVKTACPEATEAFKWGQPVYECNGPFAWMKAYENHVNFGFWRGAELQDPDGILEGEGDRMRHVKITNPEQVPVAKIDALIRQAVALNHEKGSPVRRGR